MNPTPVSLAFSDGVSRGPGSCHTIVDSIVDRDNSTEVVSSFLLEVADGKALRVKSAEHTLTRMASLPRTDNNLPIAVGQFGSVTILDGETLRQEQINGPQDEGALRDLRLIGAHVYAAGMGRQVYRRDGPGDWLNIASNLRPVSPYYLDVSGINALDGLAEDNIYAVGFNGEMWHYKEAEWRLLPSPTNLILERVRVVEDEIVYVAGQNGLLLRGHSEQWEAISQYSTADDFWGLEWFKGRLYVSTDKSIFALNQSDELVAVEIALPGPRNYSQLDAANGALWSFGPKHLSWTEDGQNWHDVQLQK